VRQPQQRLEAAQFSNLGAGEREDIALAQELHVTLLLMDDPERREEATQRALRTTGTLEVLEQAAIDGLLDLPTVLTQLLATTTFRAGAGLLQELLTRDTACKANPPTDGSLGQCPIFVRQRMKHFGQIYFKVLAVLSCVSFPELFGMPHRYTQLPATLALFATSDAPLASALAYEPCGTGGPERGESSVALRGS
jgi:hypothetical protein